ncbi:MAG: cysteine desulfurase [Bacilli bacterium]|nr:cysteine desulfurase [Bacilli bacterium]
MNREDFPIINKNYIYFDNGATTWKPKQVVDSITKYYTEYTANAHRGDYDFSMLVDNAYEGARIKVIKFINASSAKEVVFTTGTTDSLNMISEGYFKNELKENDEIILTYSEHASNVLPWFKLAKELNLKIVYLPLDNNKVTIDNFKKVITPKTKVISLAMITNVLGDLRPIKELTKIAHEHNIKVVVDGAQSVPHIKTDVQDLDIDFLAFSGHKMLGPTGIGILYAKKELMEQIKPVRLGGGMNESFDTVDKVYLKDLPTRLEAGTPNIEGAIGLSSAIDYLNTIGLDNIHKHEIELKDYCISKLKEIPHITIYNENTDSGIISFNVNGIFPQDVAVFLNKYHICLRAGNHCAKLLNNAIGEKNTLRCSFYLYNTKEEIDKMIELLKDKDKILKEMF